MHRHPGLDDGVRDQGHGVNALLDKESGEVREVGRPLAADADLAPAPLGSLDHHADHLLHRRVPLVSNAGEQAGVAVKAVGELGQIIGTDGEAIKDIGERISADDVARNLAHHVQLKAVLALH